MDSSWKELVVRTARNRAYRDAMPMLHNRPSPLAACARCKRDVQAHHLTGVGLFKLCIDCRYFGGPP